MQSLKNFFNRNYSNVSYEIVCITKNYYICALKYMNCLIYDPLYDR